MLKTALTPKWLGLLAVVVAVVIGFALLGRWQFAVAEDKGVAEATAEAAAKPTAPLLEVMSPDGSFPSGGLDRRVSMSGTYVAEHQVLVTDRKLGGEQGYWVVTPLAVDGASGRRGAGATIPVLRGFVRDAAAAPAPPTGRVTLTGTLAQSEPPPNTFQPMPDGQVQTINVPALINRWGGDMFNAFVFLGEQDPPSDAALRLVPPPTAGETDLNWRNLGYAFQWWFFAAFALYMWWRMVRDDARAAGRIPPKVDAAGAHDVRAHDVPPDGDLDPTPTDPTAAATPQGEPTR